MTIPMICITIYMNNITFGRFILASLNFSDVTHTRTRTRTRTHAHTHTHTQTHTYTYVHTRTR